MNHKTHLIFDFDGVLLDSNEVKVSAFREFASNFFSEEAAVAVVAFHKKNPGKSRFTIVDWMLDNFELNQPGFTKSQLLDNFSSTLLPSLTKASTATRLEELAAVTGVKSSIVSAAPTNELQYLVRNFGWGNIFYSRIMGAPVSKTRHFESLKGNFELGEALFIGDASSDFEVARNFDVPFVFISGWSSWSPSINEQSQFHSQWTKVDDFISHFREELAA